MAAEFLDGDQELHGGGAQLRDELAGAQQGTQRHQDSTDAHQRDGELGPPDAVGHDQSDPSTLAHTGFHERRGEHARRRIEINVADAVIGFDQHRFGCVVGGALRDELVHGLRN